MDYHKMSHKLKLADAAYENIMVHSKDEEPDITIYRLEGVMRLLEEIEEGIKDKIFNVATKIGEFDNKRDY